MGGCENEEKELVKVVSSYKKVCPDSSHGKARGGGTFKINEYQEATEAVSEVDFKGLGKMMWWGEYEEFSRTAAGGRLSPTVALARWSAWKSAPTIPKNNCGPNPEDTFQLRAPTGQACNFPNKVALNKSLVQSDGIQKSLGEDEISALKSTLFANHSEMLKTGGASMQLESFAKSMCNSQGNSASSGDTFWPRGLQLHQCSGTQQHKQVDRWGGGRCFRC